MTPEHRMVHLRPEAQPVDYWTRLTFSQREALDKISAMIHDALELPRRQEDVNRRPPWLFKETRTQLAFVDGRRGTGKTTLMTSLIGGIVDPEGLRFDPNSNIGDSLYNRVKNRLEILHNRVVCVQPLEMEGLPDNSLIMPAILARILRAVDQIAPHPDDPIAAPVSRDVQQLEQYLRRISQALDSNLPYRRGMLDREQFGEAVMAEELDRLELPSDLDSVLTSLTERLCKQGATRARRGSYTRDHGIDSRIFLVPIDDVDLNPRRCAELLRLLRTFSPPRDLFFLLLGQFELVDDIIRVSTASDFCQIQSSGCHLQGSHEADMSQRLSEVSASNLRKMVPPHSRVTLPIGLVPSEILDFAIFDEKGTILQLLSHVPLIERTGRKSTCYATLASLLGCTDETWQRTRAESDLTSLDWTFYCGIAAFHVPPRRLADCWMQFNQLVTEYTEEQHADLGDPKRFGLRVMEILRSQFIRAIDADPYLRLQTRRLLRDHPTPICVAPPVIGPGYSQELTILNSAATPKSSNTSGENPSDNLTQTDPQYAPRLLLQFKRPGSAFPEFRVASRIENSDGSLGQSVSVAVSHPPTAAALVCWHDIQAIHSCDESSPIGVSPLTSARPCIMRWLSRSGDVGYYPWPVPVLKTYAATSLFLYRWSLVVSRYFSPPEGDLVETTAQTAAITQGLGTYVADVLSVLRGATASVDPVYLDVEGLEDLALLWIVLSYSALCIDTGTREPEAIIPPPIDGSSTAKEEPELRLRPERSDRSIGICRMILANVFKLRTAFLNANRFRSYSLCDEFLKQIVLICQPEATSVIGSTNLQWFFSKADVGRELANFASLQNQSLRARREAANSEIDGWRNPEKGWPMYEQNEKQYGFGLLP